MQKIAHWYKQFSKIKRTYQKYSHLYPGFGGLFKLIYKSTKTIWSDGFSGLRNKINYYDNSHQANTIPQYFSSTHKVLFLEESGAKSFTQIDKLPTDVAVHAHIYYADQAQDIGEYLKNIPVKFHLYVTTDTSEKAKIIELALATLSNIKKFEVHITENRGRDIFPMLVTLGAKLTKHDLVLHIHSKRSPHNILALSGWRRYLMESLLGNTQRVTSIFQQFENDKDLGVLFPNYYHAVKPLVYKTNDDSNDKNIKSLVVRSGKNKGENKSEIKNIDPTFFPAGNMFWFRGKALEPLVSMNLEAKDFEQENGQVNGTLSHAIERLIPYFSSKMGLYSKAYLAKSFLSEDCSSHTLELFQNYLRSGLIRNPTILFDHNNGGGTSVYTAELTKGTHRNGGSILRVYCFNAIWFVQWIGAGDGMLFHTESMKELFDVLSLTGSTAIIVNSLYGYSDIKSTVLSIVSLSQKLDSTLDVKFHDFFALCPSPHLLNFTGKYCDVPQDLSVCAKCLKKNAARHAKQNMPSDIAEWRNSFGDLLKAATQVSFFDKSSVEIASKAFAIEDFKIDIAPHNIEYFSNNAPADLSGSLRIGFLGALSQIKGADVVNALYKHIDELGLQIPITIVGPSIVGTPKNVIIHGSYDQNELPNIIKKYGINVILMPSIAPETFSYTISEAMKMSLPIVAFDLGAQGNRVKQYDLGKVVPLDSTPEMILSAIQSVLKRAKEINK